MVLPVRLWSDVAGEGEPASAIQNQKLRMFPHREPFAEASNPWKTPERGISHLGAYERAVPDAQFGQLCQLWWAWHSAGLGDL